MCCKDLWFLEVDRPQPPGRVSLVKAATHTLEVNWTLSPSVQQYVLQVQKYDIPSTPTKVSGATKQAKQVPQNLLQSPIYQPKPEPVEAPPPEKRAVPAIPESKPTVVSGAHALEVLAAAARATQKITLSPVKQAAPVVRQTVVTAAQPIQGKHVIISKGGTQTVVPKGTLQPQIVTLVKTSTGMVATLPKGSMVQNQPKTQTVLQQQPGGKNTILKLVPASTGGGKVLTTVKGLPSNVGKLVLTKGAGGQLQTIRNQQLIVVSTNTNLQTLQTVSQGQTITLAQPKTTTLNVQPISASKMQTVKLTGIPLNVHTTGMKTVPLAKNTKQVMIGGKPITVQMTNTGKAPMTVVSANSLQSGLSNIQKIVRIPSSAAGGNTDSPKVVVFSRPKAAPVGTMGKAFLLH